MCVLLKLVAGIPCVASFHTDILDLLKSHNANWFQKFCVVFKERVDSYVLESCATTSQSFSVTIHRLMHDDDNAMSFVLLCLSFD